MHFSRKASENFFGLEVKGCTDEKDANKQPYYNAPDANNAIAYYWRRSTVNVQFR